ncbi:MAG: hypothetical protein ACFB9N_14730 [Geitlerinemataceae cyanobacterium]
MSFRERAADQYDRAKSQFSDFQNDEPVQIEAPSRVVEGVNSVLKYYLCSWAIWRPLRFLSARLTEAVILYVVVPGIKGALMGAVNPMNALPMSAPQIQKDAHALTAHVVRPVVGGTVRTVGQVIAVSAASVDAAERTRLVANTGEPVELSPVLSNTSIDSNYVWMVNYMSGTNAPVRNVSTQQDNRLSDKEIELINNR